MTPCSLLFSLALVGQPQWLFLVQACLWNSAVLCGAYWTSSHIITWTWPKDLTMTTMTWPENTGNLRRWEFLQFVGLGYPIFECLLKALDHLSKVGTLQEGRHTCTYLSKTKTKPTQNTCFVRVGRKKTLTGWALSNSSQNGFFIITQRILKKSDVLVAVLQSVRAFLSTRSITPPS